MIGSWRLLSDAADDGDVDELIEQWTRDPRRRATQTRPRSVEATALTARHASADA